MLQAERIGAARDVLAATLSCLALQRQSEKLKSEIGIRRRLRSAARTEVARAERNLAKKTRQEARCLRRFSLGSRVTDEQMVRVDAILADATTALEAAVGEKDEARRSTGAATPELARAWADKLQQMDDQVACAEEHMAAARSQVSQVATARDAQQARLDAADRVTLCQRTANVRGVLVARAVRRAESAWWEESEAKVQMRRLRRRMLQLT